MPLPGITFALVPYNNATRAFERVERVLLPTIAAHPSVECELLVSDDSTLGDPALRLFCTGRGLRVTYEWNGGRNLQYGGAPNRIIGRAAYGRIVYACTNHGVMNDPTWLDDILAPLDNPKVAMAGSVLPCLYACFGEPGGGNHVQGGVFAARTEAMRRHPYSPRYPHLGSDIWVSRELLRAGYLLADVLTIGSRWREPVPHRDRRKFVHEADALGG